MTAAPATPAGFTAPTATELLADYAAGRRRPSEVLADSLATIEATDPTVNAVVELLEDAKDAASVADEQWSSGTAPADKPLLGVPVVIKEKHGIAGRPLDQAVPATAVTPEATTRSSNGSAPPVPSSSPAPRTPSSVPRPPRTPWPTA